jgi:hypothetical protein
MCYPPSRAPRGAACNGTAHVHMFPCYSCLRMGRRVVRRLLVPMGVWTLPRVVHLDIGSPRHFQVLRGAAHLLTSERGRLEH